MRKLNIPPFIVRHTADGKVLQWISLDENEKMCFTNLDPSWMCGFDSYDSIRKHLVCKIYPWGRFCAAWLHFMCNGGEKYRIVSPKF